MSETVEERLTAIETLLNGDPAEKAAYAERSRGYNYVECPHPPVPNEGLVGDIAAVHQRQAFIDRMVTAADRRHTYHSERLHRLEMKGQPPGPVPHAHIEMGDFEDGSLDYCADIFGEPAPLPINGGMDRKVGFLDQVYSGIFARGAALLKTPEAMLQDRMRRVRWRFDRMDKRLAEMALPFWSRWFHKAKR